MNRSYKIDRNTVVVTDETGKKRMVPKYNCVEEILMLQNDIEKIHQLIDEKSQEIENNKNKKVYKWLIAIDGSLLVLISFIFLLTMTSFVGAVFHFISSKVITNLMKVALGSIGFVIPVGYFANMGSKILKQNKNLSNQIQCLKEIQYQKNIQIGQLKKSIDNSSMIQEEKTLPIPENPLEVLKKFREYLESGQIEGTIYPFIQKIIEEEEKQKQKTINSR